MFYDMWFPRPLAIGALVSLLFIAWARTHIFLGVVATDHGHATCFHYSTPYDCSTIFDTKHYAQSAMSLGLPLPQYESVADYVEHFLKVGLPAGLSPHSGPPVTKALVMTKDEWPLLRAWVLHHAYLLGPKNVYILDASTDKNVLAFLDEASRLGVVVLRSTATLSDVSKEISDVIRNLRWSCDFFFKLDTDEFIATSMPSGEVGKRVITVDRDLLRQQLAALPIDGHFYYFGYMGAAAPHRNCAVDDDPVQVAHWGSAAEPMPFHKVFLYTWTFVDATFGFHTAELRPEYNIAHVHSTSVTMAHYHYLCYERRVMVTKTVLVSVGVLRADDTAPQELVKMKQFEVDSVNRTKCIVAACHKGWIYYDHLMDPEGEREKYYALWEERLRAGDLVSWSAISDFSIVAAKHYASHGTVLP